MKFLKFYILIVFEIFLFQAKAQDRFLTNDFLKSIKNQTITSSVKKELLHFCHQDSLDLDSNLIIKHVIINNDNKEYLVLKISKFQDFYGGLYLFVNQSNNYKLIWKNISYRNLFDIKFIENNIFENTSIVHGTGLSGFVNELYIIENEKVQLIQSLPNYEYSVNNNFSDQSIQLDLKTDYHIISKDTIAVALNYNFYLWPSVFMQGWDYTKYGNYRINQEFNKFERVNIHNRIVYYYLVFDKNTKKYKRVYLSKSFNDTMYQSIELDFENDDNQWNEILNLYKNQLNSEFENANLIKKQALEVMKRVFKF